MDSSSESFPQQTSQVYPFDLYRSPRESTSTGPHQSGGSPAPFSILSPLLHPNSTSQRWSGYRQRPCLFSELPSRTEVGGEDAELSGRRAAAGGARVSQYRFGERGRGVASEPGDWSQDLVRVKRLRVDNMARREGEVGREGYRGRGSVAPMARDERSGDERGRRKEIREGRQRQRRELKLQFEETRGRLLELQRKVWRAYGEQQTEEEKTGGGGEDDGVIDEVVEMFSEGEGDDHLTEELSPPLCSSAKNHECSLNGRADRFPDASVDVELNEGDMWLGCSLVQGDWEIAGGSEKFAQALKKELASVVARVIDRVVRLYAADPAPAPAAALLQGPLTSRSLAPNPAKKPRPSTAEHTVDQAEALPLVIKRPQDKRNPLPEGKPKSALIPQSNPSLPLLPLLPQPPLPTLMPPRNKDPFMPSCAPTPPALPLPLLHYTMQQLFARSLSTMPFHKDALSNEPFMEFRSHNLSFPPVPLLGQLNPPLSDRGRDEGMRAGGVGGLDGGEAALFLGSGASQEGLSPCHLKKAKLMFFYTRYPSSNTLKTYFPDVKFNRCVTSQLIKWFSNFREFFYIQMERFARQAAREGLAPARERALHLSRNSELFRILNMHYNKSNDYQVPDRFVEVSELALREFFAAIQSGRDADPCWKKSIYKIICKLDSPVPDSFRLPGCPMDPHRMV
ncbi:prospero homeobox 3 [Brachyhypopomus gauderio]|uniref:prospero homeobox 3 n=1 Tax=Brachyhypopomus gauderio TaxID=698409 RepID=UPI00404254CD